MDGGTTTAATETQSTSSANTQYGAVARHAGEPPPRHGQNITPSSDSTSSSPIRHSHSRQTSFSDTNGDSAPRASPKMRRQMTIELPSDESFEVLYDRKLSVGDHSPKPCIIPGNALHLIDDDPSPRSQTPSSVVIIADGAEFHVDGSPSPARNPGGEGGDRSSSEPPDPRPQPRVRFRSRVRITSGVHRHRHSGTPVPQTRQRRLSSGTPSSGSSPSSSISAPLRYQADENAAWGPLGRRLSAFAAVGRRKGVPTSAQPGTEGRGEQYGEYERLDERSSLLRSGRHTAYVVPYDSHLREGDEDDLEVELREAELMRQKELVFGPWPRRLLNPHWWWWHLEPIMCCSYCSEDWDYEE